ncbi:acetate/propionate family kinase [Nonomuraea soli]|uniref:Acetate kinase n=1 Tax=Nonomuraea soli TaxID=1032476 RepID=A0A7W0CF45_9ACTN|nr:acetate/propionate family kinase [Nonomuraea soli]MBA2890038.1 acetate kinase [Nonomuraea soli]
MAVLVLNTGSSSVKYQLIEGEVRLAAGRLEGVDGLDDLLARLVQDHPVPEAIGHRVVHGGDRFRDPVLVDADVIAAIEELEPLAPLHNPINLHGIMKCQEVFPSVPQIAVFDTAFHQTLPPEAYTYAVPREWGVRRYGFHGTSCASAVRQAAALGHEGNLIVLHLGNGCSATAVRDGHSVDTSMGLTPLEGLVMGTRCGDVDPGLPGYLARVHGLDTRAVEEALTHDSGLKALAGTADLRQVRSEQALAIYCRGIRKYVGAYYALLGSVDAIIFTGGVGENSPEVRARALTGLERLGIMVDPARNEAGDQVVSPEHAEVAVLVLPADEEGEIARQTLTVLASASPH